MTYLLCQFAAFFLWFAYGSYFEWMFHKHLFHSPKLIPATYKAHAITHHGMYSRGDRYDSPAPDDPDGKHIMMDWFALPLFLAANFPIVWGVQYITGMPMIWGGLAAIAVYYMAYEWSHFVMHVPRGRWIERTRVFLFLNDHHRRHHIDDTKNLNVVFPLADLTLRTLWLPVRKSKPSGSAQTGPQRSRARG